MAKRKRRKTRTGARKKSRPKQEYRLPPLPSWFHTPVPGQCRWCGKSILKDSGEVNTRRLWHPECLEPYFLLTRPAHAKRAVKKRDKGICADCGIKCSKKSEWDLDHIVPLKDIPNRDLKWWGMENLCCRCTSCHKRKTAQENTNRRKAKIDKRKNH